MSVLNLTRHAQKGSPAAAVVDAIFHSRPVEKAKPVHGSHASAHPRRDFLWVGTDSRSTRGLGNDDSYRVI